MQEEEGTRPRARARAPEVLACPAALRFERARRRKRGGAALQRLLLTDESPSDDNEPTSSFVNFMKFQKQVSPPDKK
jgi:hypothetical protein